MAETPVTASGQPASTAAVARATAPSNLDPSSGTSHAGGAAAAAAAAFLPAGQSLEAPEWETPRGKAWLSIFTAFASGNNTKDLTAWKRATRQMAKTFADDDGKIDQEKVAAVKKVYKSEKLLLLISIDFDVDVKPRKSFSQRLEELQDFKAQRGHASPKVTDLSHPGLGYWAIEMRKKYRNKKAGRNHALTDEKIAKLEEIGFIFVPRPASAKQAAAKEDIGAATKAEEDGKKIPALPPGWVEHNDADGRPFYAHPDKGTTWERPRDKAQPPPPPPPPPPLLPPNEQRDEAPAAFGSAAAAASSASSSLTQAEINQAMIQSLGALTKTADNASNAIATASSELAKAIEGVAENRKGVAENRKGVAEAKAEAREAKETANDAKETADEAKRLAEKATNEENLKRTARKLLREMVEDGTLGGGEAPSSCAKGDAAAAPKDNAAAARPGLVTPGPGAYKTPVKPSPSAAASYDVQFGTPIVPSVPATTTTTCCTTKKSAKKKLSRAERKKADEEEKKKEARERESDRHNILVLHEANINSASAPSLIRKEMDEKMKTASEDYQAAFTAGKEACRKYSSDYSINGRARAGGYQGSLSLSEDIKFKNILNPFLGFLPPFREGANGLVYRAIEIKDAQDLKFWQVAADNGALYEDPGFLSTTWRPFENATAYTSRNTRMIIQAKTGRYVKEYVKASYKHEEEILFKTRTKFQVLSFDDMKPDEPIPTGAKYRIVMKEVVE